MSDNDRFLLSFNDNLLLSALLASEGDGEDKTALADVPVPTAATAVPASMAAAGLLSRGGVKDDSARFATEVNAFL